MVLCTLFIHINIIPIYPFGIHIDSAPQKFWYFNFVKYLDFRKGHNFAKNYDSENMITTPVSQNNQWLMGPKTLPYHFIVSIEINFSYFVKKSM